MFGLRHGHVVSSDTFSPMWSVHISQISLTELSIYFHLEMGLYFDSCDTRIGVYMERVTRSHLVF